MRGPRPDRQAPSKSVADLDDARQLRDRQRRVARLTASHHPGRIVHGALVFVGRRSGRGAAPRTAIITEPRGRNHHATGPPLRKRVARQTDEITSIVIRYRSIDRSFRAPIILIGEPGRSCRGTTAARAGCGFCPDRAWREVCWRCDHQEVDPAVPNDFIFQPLHFRNLTVSNRLFRSSISGRIDNYDGSGTLARVNFEKKLARWGRGDHLVSRPGPRPRADLAQLRDDRPGRADPVLEAGRTGSPELRRLQVHPPVVTLRPAAGPGRRREPPEGAQELDEPARGIQRVPLSGDDRGGDPGNDHPVRRRRPPCPRGGGRTGSSSTPPTATCSPSSSVRRSTTAPTATAVPLRTGRGSCWR